MDVHKFIPVKNIIGPGSQSDDFQEGTLEYMRMPTQMETFQAPLLPEPGDLSDIAAAMALLQQVSKEMARFDGDSVSQIFSVSQLRGDDLELVNQLLGVGEVSVSIDGDIRVEIQESVMAGLWRVRELHNAQIVSDYIEIAQIPNVVRQRSFDKVAMAVDARLDNLPSNTINSPSILTELNARGINYRVGDDPLVINLSLLPLSDADITIIGTRLGVGPVTILSRGYGNCRIGSTAVNNVWWIKYYNSDDALILNTIEVVDIPEVAQADLEDIKDSSERLLEMLEIYL